MRDFIVKLFFILFILVILAVIFLPFTAQAQWGSGGGGTFRWNKSGATQKTDSLRFIQGANVTLTQSGNAITIASSGGAGVTDSTTITDLSVAATDLVNLSILNGKIANGAITVNKFATSVYPAIRGKIGWSTNGTITVDTLVTRIEWGGTANTSHKWFDADNDSVVFRPQNLNVIEYKDATTSLFLVDSTGQVGLGVGTPTANLHVLEDAKLGNGRVYAARSSDNGLLQIFDSSGGADAQFLANGTSYVATGNFGLGTTAPDKTLEVNLGTTSHLRLTYNDANGSAATYADLGLNSAGEVTVDPTGGVAIFGSGDATATPVGLTLRTPNGSGTNIAGGALTIAGGRGTGSGAGGDIIFQTALAGGSGSSLNALTTRFRVSQTGNLGIGSNTFGSSALRTIAHANGTAPAAGTSGQYSLYAINGEPTILSGSGLTSTLANAYGALYLAAGSATISIANATQWTKVTGLTAETSPAGNGLTVVADSITVNAGTPGATPSGTYIVTVKIDLTSGSATNDTYRFAVMVNQAVNTKYFGDVSLNTSNGTQNASFTALVTATASDDLSLVVRNLTDADDPTLVNVNFIVQRIN